MAERDKLIKKVKDSEPQNIPADKRARLKAKYFRELLESLTAHGCPTDGIHDNIHLTLPDRPFERLSCPEDKAKCEAYFLRQYKVRMAERVGESAARVALMNCITELNQTIAALQRQRASALPSAASVDQLDATARYSEPAAMCHTRSPSPQQQPVSPSILVGSFFERQEAVSSPRTRSVSPAHQVVALVSQFFGRESPARARPSSPQPESPARRLLASVKGVLPTF